MKLTLLCLLFAALAGVYGDARLDKIDINILDHSKGSCKVKINPGTPRSVDIDVESFIEANDITIKFAAYSLIDGHYNEFIETESVRLCELAKSENPLVAFVHLEMKKAGNFTEACPVKKGHYYMHNFQILEGDLPMALPQGQFKVEVNGTIHEHDKDTPLYTAEIYFIEG